MIADPRSVASSGSLSPALPDPAIGGAAFRRLRLPIASIIDWAALAFLAVLVVGAVTADKIPGLVGPNLPFGDFSHAPTLTANGLLGTDALGRRIFSRVIYGALSSLPVAGVATFSSLLVGLLLGSMLGLYSVLS